ncbi:MAG: hypothetical protein BMS9Abin37_0316 [Acidobacteriota bacterium]|nr:MAG: hypothetical protein BMS9Abin37_0316 [Acidobacteriota bacterium]
MTQDEEPGFTLHFGCISMVIVILGIIAVVWWSPSKNARWITGLVAIVVVGTPVVMTFLESRWFIVTAADRDRGVPGTCPHCREELTAVIGKRRYTVRCGICGHRQKGRLDS